MATDVQLAAFSINAYRPTDTNRIIVPAWTELASLSRPHTASGFGATVYQGPTTPNDGSEVVIAFRGTDFDGGMRNDFIFGNTAYFGVYNSQIREAIEVISDVMDAFPGARIKLTGHSLGGGLASLMAVYFNLPAFVFAPAPFQAAADPVDPFADYQSYQTAKGRSIDSDFQTYRNDPFHPLDPSSLFRQRAGNPRCRTRDTGISNSMDGLAA